MDKIKSTDGFKLIRLQLFENEIFDDIDIVFYDNEDKTYEPYTSLIIGPNGTGKSNLLRIVILLFHELKHFKSNKKRIAKISGKFSLTYQIGQKRYRYFNAEFKQTMNGQNVNEVAPQVWSNRPILEYEDIEIPECIIALSIMLTDKFPAELDDFNNYHYLGVKYNASTARTTTFIRKTVKLLFEALDKDFLQENINKGLEFLEYEPYLFVTYTPRYKHIIFQDNLTETTFENFFTNFWEYTRRSPNDPPWSLRTFKRLKRHQPEKIPKLVKLCHKIKNNLKKYYPGGRSEYFSFNILERSYTNEELNLINDLYSLDLISYPKLSFYKKQKKFEIEDSSSGEYHFISSFIGLLATIRKNSLILIDEPENSLHPNWQMKYISFLKSVFKEYTSCHFVIATHSHFMVSDLNGSTSTLNVLRKNEKVSSELIPSNTFGWSAEDILFDVFQTPSTRNYYLSEQLGQIFKLVSEEPNFRNVEEINKKIKQLKKLDLSGLKEEDPLKDVLLELFKKFPNA